ncbi:MAG TPA: hypothetical protein VLG10_16115 [Methylomirabilota bacterium]|nr:hypothetical protein [Methylomirabilota bacterium]
MKALAVVLAVVLFTPELVGAQGGQAVSGSTGVTGISGANTIQGATIQGANTGLGAAANTAANGLRGQNVNANLNTNQNTTGVNIGGINYTGGPGNGGEGAAATSGDDASMSSTFASPSQYIGFGSSTNYSTSLLQIPGFLGVPSNFSQPYKPDLWVNGPGPIVPSTLTLAQAEECRAWGVSSDWDGGERPATDAIELIWPSLGQKFPTMSSPAGYVGTSKVSSTEKYSFMATICQAAYEAMKKGATKGIVTFVIRPKNKSAGIGLGTTGGGSWLPSGVTNTHPYAVAGSVGFGTGWAKAYAEGELMMHVVALRETKAASPRNNPTASAPTPQVADKPRDDAERTRQQATDRAWFGAPASPAQLGATRPQPAPLQGPVPTPADSPAAMSGPIQQVAEKPQPDPGTTRAPMADKAWFGGSYTR